MRLEKGIKKKIRDRRVKKAQEPKKRKNHRGAGNKKKLRDRSRRTIKKHTSDVREGGGGGKGENGEAKTE